jgi:hypothetical protein
MDRQHRNDQSNRETLRTVIPTPRDAAIFPGWGVKF